MALKVTTRSESASEMCNNSLGGTTTTVVIWGEDFQDYAEKQINAWRATFNCPNAPQLVTEPTYKRREYPMPDFASGARDAVLLEDFLDYLSYIDPDEPYYYH